MYIFKLFICDMGIDLSCGDLAVTQHQLNGPKIRSPFQEMSRKGVPEHMRADGKSKTGLIGIPPEKLPEALPGEYFPS